MQQLIKGFEEVSDLELMMTEGGYYGTGGGYVSDSYVQQHALNYTPTKGSTGGYPSTNPINSALQSLSKMGVDVSIIPPSLSLNHGTITVNGSGLTIKGDNGQTFNFTVNPLSGTASMTFSIIF